MLTGNEIRLFHFIWRPGEYSGEWLELDLARRPVKARRARQVLSAEQSVSAR